MLNSQSLRDVMAWGRDEIDEVTRREILTGKLWMPDEDPWQPPVQREEIARINQAIIDDLGFPGCPPAAMDFATALALCEGAFLGNERIRGISADLIALDETFDIDPDAYAAIARSFAVHEP